MKQRTITAIIALCLFIPIVLAGGLWMDWLTVLFAAVGISEIFLMKKQILVSFNFLLALLATLTWTVPDSFFKVFPSNITKLGVFYGNYYVVLDLDCSFKNKTTFDDVGVYILAALYIGIGFHYMGSH
nr:phosphatidate cytidylyltransferase [Lactobacillus crispatus]